MAGGAGEGTSWSGNYNAQCLHKEAKTVAESIIGAGKFPDKIIITSFSQGGIAVKNMFIKINSHQELSTHCFWILVTAAIAKQWRKNLPPSVE